MILAPAGAEKNTRTAAEEWLDSAFRSQESEFRSRELGARSYTAPRIPSWKPLKLPHEHHWLHSRVFSDAVNLNSRAPGSGLLNSDS